MLRETEQGVEPAAGYGIETNRALAAEHDGSRWRIASILAGMAVVSQVTGPHSRGRA